MLLAALAGALLPDLSLYLLAGISLFILQIPPDVVFDELYFSPAWQTIFGIDNSFLIWGAILGLALWRQAPVWIAFAAAGLIHLATDFAMHNDDARMHLWPLTDWRFESPVSYWDSRHYAAWLVPFTITAAAISAVALFRRYRHWGLRILWAGLFAAELYVARNWLLFF